MRQTRIYVRHPLTPGARVVLPPGPSQHVTLVLRLAGGDAVTLFNGDGRDYLGRLLDANRTATTVVCGSCSEEEPLPPLHIHLALGISKGERMDFATQKAVELGVAELTPLYTSRSIVRLTPDRLAKRQSHWEGVIIAACEQSGRRRLPLLRQAMSLDAWLADSRAGGILLDHRSTTPLPALPRPAGGLVLLVGPEGGLTASEQTAAKATGFTAARLGPRVLRTETAPLAAIAAIQTLWGDFTGPALPNDDGR